MYILELAGKIYTKIKTRDFKFSKKEAPESMMQENEEYERCEHIFVPIDSTKKVLACSKCGYVIKVDPKKIPKSNPFGS